MSPPIKHGLCRRGKKQPTEYVIWIGMKQRCQNQTAPDYDRYGGRGITVCEEWSNDFLAFYSDMGDRPSKSHSIERINNDGPYAKWNCKWASVEEQTANRRKPKGQKSYFFEGKERTLSELCREHNMRFDTVWHRINKAGLTIEDALRAPVKNGRWIKSYIPS